MIISVIILIISFLFEGLMSSYFSSSFASLNMFSTMYTLIALIVIFPYFYNEKKYYILLIIFGVLMDIIYTNTFMMNVILFIIISIFIRILNYLLPENVLMLNIISVSSVVVYHILSFIILKIINYNVYPISTLFDICINSILMTIIYTSLLYFISKYFFIKLDKKQIR